MSEILKNIELRSEEFKEVMTTIPNRIIRYGNIIMLSLILIVLLLLWFIKYPDIIKSTAIISTKIPAQKEYSKITAKIDTILVEDKEKVTADQPLAILENSAHFNDVLILKSLLNTTDIQDNIAQLIIVPSQNWVLGEVKTDFDHFETTYTRYKLYKDLQPFSNEELANKNSIIELNNQLHELKSQQEINVVELDLKKNKLKRSNILFEKGVISAREHEQEQLEYITAERAFKNLNIAKSQINSLISNANSVSSGTRIRKTNEEITLQKEMIQASQNLKKSITDWEMKYVLKAKINGFVSYLGFWSKHQTVNKGDMVFTVIPNENTEYLAKLQSPIQNSGKIKVGQKVNITLSNYNEAEFGRLNGTVQNISSIPDQNNFYIVYVSLPDKLITTSKKELVYTQEMSGDAEIIIDDLRLIEKLFFKFKNKLSR